ncbi:MAG: hypothetical protein NG747_03245 [Candidatus Brocadia sp.]|nr:hypothetical protein [Candidatus Brocadia sp.]
MQKKISKSVIDKAIILSIPFLILLSIQSAVFSKTGDESLWRIQGYALKNANVKTTKSNTITVMGTFATSEEPTTIPVPLAFEFPTFSKFYVGVAIINTSSSDKDVTVTFALSGARSGKEDAEFTVPGGSTFLAYIDDTLGRPGFYVYKVGVKDLGSSKITLMLTE